MISYLIPHAPIILDTDNQDIKRTRTALQTIAKEIMTLDIETIVVIAPHGDSFSDVINIRDTTHYQSQMHADYIYPKDQAVIDYLVNHSETLEIPYYPIGDDIVISHHLDKEVHYAFEVPLYDLILQGFKGQFVFITYSPSRYDECIRAGKCIKEAGQALGREILVIASGDMSHNHTISFDEAVKESINTHQAEKILEMKEETIESAQECGLRSLAMLLGIYDENHYQSQVLSYESPYGVGYLAAKFTGSDQARSESLSQTYKAFFAKRMADYLEGESDIQRYVRQIVKDKIRNGFSSQVVYLEDGRTIKVGDNTIDFDPALFQRMKDEIPSGLFVTFYKWGGLRGCIGITHNNKEPLGKCIAYYGIQAATNDGRFDPLEESEIDECHIKVDILTPMTKVLDRKNLNPKQYGIRVSNGQSSAVLLPNLPGIDTIEQQVEIACSKGGFSVDNLVEIYRFSVERIE